MSVCVWGGGESEHRPALFPPALGPTSMFLTNVFVDERLFLSRLFCSTLLALAPKTKQENSAYYILF